MSFRRMSLALAFASSFSYFGLAAAEPCLAGVPSIQLSGINEIVRVSKQADGTGGRGSGSVFANVFDSDTDTRFLCVLTADHVLKSGNGGSIAFQDTPYSTNIGPFYPAAFSVGGQYADIYVQGQGFHHPDLGVMVVPVPDTPYFQGLVPFNLVTPAAYDPMNPTRELDENEQYPLTTRGFGLTGPLTSIFTVAGGLRDAYLEDLDSYGTQRFSNNLIEAYELYEEYVAGNIKYRDIQSAFHLSPAAMAILGEGTGMRGDSGGPMLNEDAFVSLLANGTLVPGFTKDIEGVFVRGFAEDEFPIPGADRFIVDFGKKYAGVTLIPEYIDWAQEQCYDNVPEPTTLALLAVACAGLLIRRRSIR